jgi:hypothetical protein
MPQPVATESLAIAGLMTLVGLCLGWLGYRIRFRGDYHLIAGYRSGAVANPEELAGLVGGVTAGLGVVTVFYGLVALVVDAGLWYWLSYTLVVLAGPLVVQLGQ